MTVRLQFGVVALGAILSTSCFTKGSVAAAPDGPPAHYVGVVTTEWLRDGRTMKLLNAFAYVDRDGTRWVAPKGSSIDGASIPKALWWSGGPYEGDYREASVVHDVYCAEAPKTATWRAVHRMFYEAMMTSGVAKTRALIMYGAVYRHGPRWPDPTPPGVPAVPPAPKTGTPLEDDVKRIESLVTMGEVDSPEEIEALPLSIPPE